MTKIVMIYIGAVSLARVAGRVTDVSDLQGGSLETHQDAFLYLLLQHVLDGRL